MYTLSLFTFSQFFSLCAKARVISCRPEEEFRFRIVASPPAKAALASGCLTFGGCCYRQWGDGRNHRSKRGQIWHTFVRVSLWRATNANDLWLLMHRRKVRVLAKCSWQRQRRGRKSNNNNEAKTTLAEAAAAGHSNSKKKN